MPRPINPEDLVIHILNVGFGDNIIIEFPIDANGIRNYGLVDCKDTNKTIDYLDKLNLNNSQANSRLAFVCATHPHFDHIGGIRGIIRNRSYYPLEFWESGFRHNSLTYQKILEDVFTNHIKMIRVSSGMEWYFGQVRFTALAPSIMLRNKYATYGVDMNNASIVLRIEHTKENSILMQSKEYKGSESKEAVRRSGRSVVILGGDAEFDSWAQISNEFPKLERSSTHIPLVKKMINYLSCDVIKVSHHGSMHSTPLDIYEKINPRIAIISAEQSQSTKSLLSRTITRDLFPHKSAIIALEESDTSILTTDGSYENQILDDGSLTDPRNAHPGSIIIVIPPGGRPRYQKLNDLKDHNATPLWVV